MKFFIAFCCLLAFSMAEDDGFGPFDSFAERMSKKYHPEEKPVRMGVWSANVARIDNHNAQAAAGNQSYTMAENDMCDQTPSEMAARLGSVTPYDADEDRSSNLNVQEIDLRSSVPTSYDLRSDSCMPGIKNQGRCGSCWAFGAVNPLEYLQCKKTGSLTLLSEQQLVDCSGSECQGGFYTTAWYHLYYNGGLMGSSGYPYQARRETCRFSSSDVVTRISNYRWVYPYRNEEAMKIALYQNGPLSVALYANQNFMLYSSGFFNDPSCPTTTINHAVNIVGYGTDPTHGDFWVIRNSWGTSWGVSGYMIMKRGVNMCAINGWSAYPMIR